MYTGNMENRLEDLGTKCVSKVLLAAAVQLIARTTVSWGEFSKRQVSKKKKTCIPNMNKVNSLPNQ